MNFIFHFYRSRKLYFLLLLSVVTLNYVLMLNQATGFLFSLLQTRGFPHKNVQYPKIDVINISVSFHKFAYYSFRQGFSP